MSIVERVRGLALQWAARVGCLNSQLKMKFIKSVIAEHFRPIAYYRCTVKGQACDYFIRGGRYGCSQREQLCCWNVYHSNRMRYENQANLDEFPVIAPQLFRHCVTTSRWRVPPRLFRCRHVSINKQTIQNHSIRLQNVFFKLKFLYQRSHWNSDEMRRVTFLTLLHLIDRSRAASRDVRCVSNNFFLRIKFQMLSPNSEFIVIFWAHEEP